MTDSQAPSLSVVQTNIDTYSESKPQLSHPHPPRHSSLCSITTNKEYNAVIFGISQPPQECLTIPKNIVIIPWCLPFSQNYMKTPILGVLSMTVSVLGGAVVAVLIPGRYWLLSALPLKWGVSLLIIALCPPPFPLNLTSLLLRWKLRWFFTQKNGSSSKQAQFTVKSRSTVVLLRDGAGSKWPPVHKVYEQLPKKRSRGVKKAYRLHHIAFLLLNLL